MGCRSCNIFPGDADDSGFISRIVCASGCEHICQSHRSMNHFSVGENSSPNSITL